MRQCKCIVNFDKAVLLAQNGLEGIRYFTCPIILGLDDDRLEKLESGTYKKHLHVCLIDSKSVQSCSD